MPQCHQRPWWQQDQHLRWSYPHGPCLSQRQDHHICPHLSQRPGPLACLRLEKRWDLHPCLRKSTSGVALPWKWTMSTTGSRRRPVSNWPVSKRQQHKGLGPSVYILSFNSIEALEKNYLAQLPSRSPSDPAFHWERERVLNRIAVDKIMMKNRVSGPSLSIELPPPGETSVGFLWRPVPEYLASLLGIGEPLTAGDPLLSQTGQLPHPLSQTSLRKAQWFNLCPMMDPFFKETVEVMKEIAPTWCTQDMHAIMQWLCEAYQLKKPTCFKIREDTPNNM